VRGPVHRDYGEAPCFQTFRNNVLKNPQRETAMNAGWE